MPISRIRALTPIFMAGCVVALGAVLVIGSSVNGQRNWIDFGGPFRLQPSEFAKLGVILWGARVLSNKYHLIEQTLELTVPLIPMYGLVLALILAEGDLGTAMVMTPIMAAPLWLVGAPKKWFKWGGIVGLLAIAGFTLAHPYRMQRFASFLRPNQDLGGINFQVHQGLWALGTGGWSGLGPGASRQKWGSLPEAHTDFIYAVLGEEMGLVGTLLTLGLFAALVFTAVRIARQSNDRFVQLVSFGIATWIATQVAVNIGAVLRLAPVTGVPLPLVSYGGSSLIPTLLGMGILMSFARQAANK
jgi:cell division protein FtsW